MNTQRPRYTHEEIQEFLGVYALDAVDSETVIIVEQHLKDCVKCSIEVAQHHEVAGLLANSGGAPPARLWDVIASRVGGSTAPSWERLARRLESDTDTEGQIGDFLDGGIDESIERLDFEGVGSTVIPIAAEQRPRRLAVRAASIVAAAAAVIAIVLGVQVDHLNHQVNALQSPALLTQAEQSAINSPSTKLIQLTASRTPRGSALEGRVTVVLTKSGTGFVEAGGLASLSTTEIYQLWGVIGSQTISLGLLGSEPSVVAFSVAGDVAVEAFAITAEHSGGVVQSSNQPVVAGEVAA